MLLFSDHAAHRGNSSFGVLWKAVDPKLLLLYNRDCTLRFDSKQEKLLLSHRRTMHRRTYWLCYVTCERSESKFFVLFMFSRKGSFLPSFPAFHCQFPCFSYESEWKTFSAECCQIPPFMPDQPLNTTSYLSLRNIMAKGMLLTAAVSANSAI